MDALELYKESPQFAQLVEGACKLLEGAQRSGVFETYTSFLELAPRDTVLFLDLIEATSFDQSLWFLKAGGEFKLAVLPYEVGVWLAEESHKAEDGRIKPIYYEYEDFPQYILQYCPLRPNAARLWKKRDGENPELVEHGRLAELRFRLAELQNGVLSPNGKMNGSDPARPWTLEKPEEMHRPGISWTQRREIAGHGIDA